MFGQLSSKTYQNLRNKIWRQEFTLRSKSALYNNSKVVTCKRNFGNQSSSDGNLPTYHTHMHYDRHKDHYPCGAKQRPACLAALPPLELLLVCHACRPKSSIPLPTKPMLQLDLQKKPWQAQVSLKSRANSAHCLAMAANKGS